MNIEIISGSPRKQSLTVRAAYAVQKWFQKHTEHHVGIIDCREHQLPWIEKVFNSIDNTPDPWKPLFERVFKADAFIFVTPEYNGSYSPSLKNLVDHFPKQLHKTLGVVTASNGGFGGMRAAQQLILLGAGLFTIVCPQLLVIPTIDKKIDENGDLIDPAFEKSIHNFASEYLWLAEKIAHKG
ncbi:NADPH-dependent FMN reductase [Niabella insulamsoli]|uniref:NADPH-dependent FMN reductase n=1 Tax=Niabella insulamsoli TaxID=3144874 RepID=UPI0031FBB6B3